MVMTGQGPQPGQAPVSPSCQGRYCPRDQALRLTLTPSPRLCGPGFSTSGSSPPLCAVCGEAARHSLTRQQGGAGTLQEG